MDALPRRARLRLRRHLCGDRILDQRQGRQRQPRRALRRLPDRHFRRLGGRPVAAARVRAGFVPALQRRRRAAGAGDRAAGDDQRRPAGPPKSIRLRLPWLIRLAPVSALGALVAGRRQRRACSRSGRSTRLQIGVEPSAVPLFTAAIVAGSALGVYPAGRISDQMDRRAGDGRDDDRRRRGRDRAGVASFRRRAADRDGLPGRPDDLHALYARRLARQRPRQAARHGGGLGRRCCSSIASARSSRRRSLRC